jgi:hypothetical protein
MRFMPAIIIEKHVGGLMISVYDVIYSAQGGTTLMTKRAEYIPIQGVGREAYRS